VECRRAGAPDQRLGGCAVDRAGTFRVARIAPGPVAVALVAADATGNRLLTVPTPVAWLGSFDPVGAPLHVDLRAGATTTIELPVAAPGELRGRVLAAGRPLVGAIVYAHDAAPVNPRFALWEIEPWSDERHEFCPHTRTDADGRFRFLVGRAGTWELRTRAAAGSPWSPPDVVTFAALGERRDVELRVAAAAIRGSFDQTAMPAAERRRVRAELYPLAAADQDAFFESDHLARQGQCVPHQELAEGGAFAFECVPPGGWVLRIVASDRPSAILWQRVVHTTNDDVQDLGSLQPPPRHVVRVLTGAAADIGVWVMEPHAGNARGVFVATIGGVHEDAFVLGGLPAGRYRLHPFQRGTMFAGHWGVYGEATGTPVELEVHADGRVTPDVVWPDGVR
jgi:hypothetical protein